VVLDSDSCEDVGREVPPQPTVASASAPTHISEARRRLVSTDRAYRLRCRVLVPAVKRANELLIARDAARGLTPHSLGRTFAGVLYALGESPPYVMAHEGHTSPTWHSRSTRARWTAATASPSGWPRSSGNYRATGARKGPRERGRSGRGCRKRPVNSGILPE
jgi:hypothetical protein